MYFNPDVRFVAVAFLTLLLSIVVHEFAHAWVADRMGDDTARRQGLLTLNPLAQMQRHKFGSFLVPLIGPMFGMVIGWGSVPVDYVQVDRKYTLRQAQFRIAIAGPLANLLLAALALGVYAIFAQMVPPYERAGNPVFSFTVMMVQINLLLAAFNMLPVPPLDGFTVLSASAPRTWTPALTFIEQNGAMLFALVFIVGSRLFGPLAQLGVFLLQAVD